MDFKKGTLFPSEKETKKFLPTVSKSRLKTNSK